MCNHAHNNIRDTTAVKATPYDDIDFRFVML